MPDGTKVYAKVSKDTDTNELRRWLQRQYPSAQIEIEGGKPLIKEIREAKGVWFKPGKVYGVESSIVFMHHCYFASNMFRFHVCG